MAKPRKTNARQAATSAQTSLFEAPLSSDVATRIDHLSQELARVIDALPLAAKVDALNRARLALHAVSPFVSEPVDCVLWFPERQADANQWNPNGVPPPEMVALTHSMRKYGITMPIVGNRVGDPEPASSVRVRIDDGFHRNIVIRTDPVVSQRVHGYMPFSLLKGVFTEADEMSATILHNQARGTHSIVKEVAIVQALEAEGWDTEQIGIGTVKSTEELVRIGQLAGGGAATNLASKRYAKSWTF